jgi:hypothetical protein
MFQFTLSMSYTYFKHFQEHVQKVIVEATKFMQTYNNTFFSIQRRIRFVGLIISAKEWWIESRWRLKM